MHKYRPLMVRYKKTGEERCIKDYRFDPELHEKLGFIEMKEPKAVEPAMEIVRDSINADMTRKELEVVGHALGLTAKDMRDCSNKTKLLELIHRKL